MLSHAFDLCHSVIPLSFVIRISSFVPLPALARIAYRGQALTKLRLLAFGFSLLLRLARLLLRTRTRSTAREYNAERWNEKHGGCQLFHRRTRIIKLMSAATFQEIRNALPVKY